MRRIKTTYYEIRPFSCILSNHLSGSTLGEGDSMMVVRIRGLRPHFYNLEKFLGFLFHLFLNQLMDGFGMSGYDSDSHVFFSKGRQ
jgi:hypothetical protein